MQKEITKLNDLLLVGVFVRTNNKNEMDPETSKIKNVFATYFGNQVAENFKNRKNPGVFYSVYTEYESDEHGDYTYFLGEEVNSLENQNAEFKTITIPAGSYQKFTTEPGKMPDVVINAWQAIWKMTEKDFGGKRKYAADFEIYDQRAMNPSAAVVDVYIGLQD